MINSLLINFVYSLFIKETFIGGYIMVKKTFLVLFLSTALSLNCASSPDSLADEMLGVSNVAPASFAMDNQEKFTQSLGLEAPDYDLAKNVEFLIKFNADRDNANLKKATPQLSTFQWLLGIVSNLFYAQPKVALNDTDLLSASAVKVVSKPQTDALSASPTQIVEIIDTVNFPKGLVYDQKELNACTANAMAFIIRYLSIRKSLPIKSIPIRFPAVSNPPIADELKQKGILEPSRRYHYFNSGYTSGKTSQNYAVSMEEAIIAMDKYGSCPEGTFRLDKTLGSKTVSLLEGCPYETSNFTQPSPECYRFGLDGSYSGMCDDVSTNPYSFISQSIRYDILGDRTVDSSSGKSVFTPSIDKFKLALNDGSPIYFGASLYSAFMDPTLFKGSKFFVPMPTDPYNGTAQILQGGHATVIVGYGNYNPAVPSKNYFKVLNSWGPNWADSGFCYFPEEYVKSYTVSAYSVYLKA